MANHKPNMAAVRNRARYTAGRRWEHNKLRRAKKNGVELVPQDENMVKAKEVLAAKAILDKIRNKKAFDELKKAEAKAKRQPAGGKFFKVWSKGKQICTEWAYDIEDLKKHLNNKRTHFDRIVDLV
jgi:hypothetical protein